MRNSRRRRLLAGLLGLALIVPSATLLAPRPAHAQTVDSVFATIIGGLGDIQETLSAGFDAITSSSIAGINVKEYVLDPIAFAVTQSILQAITASVVSWINGSNSSGTSLFVQDLGAYLRASGDVLALNFINQIAVQSNSPFAGAIASALYVNYTQSTSLAGFWAANQCTLQNVSANALAFVAGNFTQGGWNAWFALTTQPQNNPYLLYYSTQAALSAQVNSAIGSQLTQLGWGQGFMSWCGTSANGTGGLTQNPAGQIVQPPGSCLDSNGHWGQTQTPGSVIHDQLSQTLGAGVAKLVSADEINEMIGTIAQALVTKVIGETGLLGVSTSVAGAPSYISQYAAENPLTASSTTGTGTTGGSATATLSSNIANEITQIQNYQSAWVTIGSAAQTASTSVAAVISCYATHGGDSGAAHEALSGEVAPVVTKAANAASIAAGALTKAQQVQAEAQNATSLAATTQAATDYAALANSPPSVADATRAQADATATGEASSTSATSLKVSGGTTFDQMTLISSNAGNALAACQGGIH